MNAACCKKVKPHDQKRIYCLVRLHPVVLDAERIGRFQLFRHSRQAGGRGAKAACTRIENNLLLDKERLRDAQQQLLGRPELAQRPLYVLDKVDFFDGTHPRIELIVAHRSGKDVPLNIYTFENGTWHAEPIEQDYSDNYIAKHQMQLDDTDWAQVADVARVWQEKAREVKAVETEPYYISLVWLPPQRKRFWHTATLEAVGKQYYLSLHENGTVWEWKRPAAEKE